MRDEKQMAVVFVAIALYLTAQITLFQMQTSGTSGLSSVADGFISAYHNVRDAGYDEQAVPIDVGAGDYKYFTD